MNIINKKINYGFVNRIILTIIFFIFLKKMENITIIQKYLYLILFIFLLFLDCLDILYEVYSIKSIFNLKLLVNLNNQINSNEYYKINDKIIDILSYLLLFLFDIDNYLKFFIIYRLVGIIIFIYTKNEKVLFIFFDFVKEYLFYVFILGKNYNYILYFLIAKIILEIYLYNIKK